ncbi:DUF5060 domain-containing protein [Hyunsoonleella sp. 2307UL5-6]|uniref:DUF5060 domain-containing protein n=1 Tax=Hyunsoonleella sp. 2307UL5-6 TaxID=3384768 RepID=UPI0039BD537A
MMKYINLTLVLSLIVIFQSFAQNVSIEGQLKKWEKITLNFEGDDITENDANNPFLNYRLNVIFKNNGRVFTVPGFFAADGNAAETSATSGKIWQVRFMPDAVGKWEYEVFFRTGKNIAISDDIYAGEPVSFNGVRGEFNIDEASKEGSSFKQKGRLIYDDSRYLKYADTKDAFIKGGADSPENFLAFFEFDQTPASHKYVPHAKDWRNGDPTWKNGKGKNIIGALNYLASKEMNSVYFLTMNVQGDGNDVWPWTDENERYRFDCSKLDQWEKVFDHMDNLGLMLHIVTQETENELLLDIGELKTQRKLYYRELIARFSHHLGVIWNLGEENGWQNWAPKAQNDADRKAMSKYIKTHDPYKNLVLLHTHAVSHAQDHILNPLLGYRYLDGPSLQIKHPSDVHEIAKKWISKSSNFGKPWVVMQDEIGPAHTGAKPDADDPEHDAIRHQVLWGNLMAGGAGVEWYFGYKYANNDLNCEDWRSRDNLWEQTKHALHFFKIHIPFQDMVTLDDATDNLDDYVLAKHGEIYAVYLPKVKATTLNLTGVSGKFSVRWYNPRTGGSLQKGKVKTLKGGKHISIGMPPNKEKDWVALIKRQSDVISNASSDANRILLNALTDFTSKVTTKTNYYKDKKNKALAINASKEPQRKGFASASTIFKGKTGMYNVVLHTMAEQDGESTYHVSINHTKVKSASNPKVTESFKAIKLNMGTLYLKTNDTITIASNAHTNGTLPEKGGTAWSRGRWNGISFVKSNILQNRELQNATPYLVQNDILAVEAENFHFNSNNYSPREWYVRSLKGHTPFLDISNHSKTASGESYIEALPDTRKTHDDKLIRGENFFPIPGSGGLVGYKVKIDTPGKYYVWVKAYSSGPEDNGVHVGIDGDWPESGQRIQLCKGKHKWTWSSAQRVPENHCGTPKTIFLEVKEAGEHVIFFSMREDGFKLDKFILTSHPDFDPKR